MGVSSRGFFFYHGQVDSVRSSACQYTRLTFQWVSYWTLSPMINQGCLHTLALIDGRCLSKARYIQCCVCVVLCLWLCSEYTFIQWITSRLAALARRMRFFTRCKCRCPEKNVAACPYLGRKKRCRPCVHMYMHGCRYDHHKSLPKQREFRHIQRVHM